MPLCSVIMWSNESRHFICDNNKADNAWNCPRVTLLCYLATGVGESCSVGLYQGEIHIYICMCIYMCMYVYTCFNILLKTIL